MPNVKILIYTNAHDPLDAVIKFLTHGRGSHASFLRQDGKTIHEAFYPNVHDRALTPLDLQQARAFEIPNLTPNQNFAFECLFDRNIAVGITYSIEDLLRYALNRPNRDETHTFCSRYVMSCCRKILQPSQIPLVRLRYQDWCSPSDLLTSPRLIESRF